MLEDERTEFKKDVAGSIAKAAVAFSNTEGGRILVGIDDAGNVVGIEDTDEVSKSCAQILRDQVRPNITMYSKISLLSFDNKNVVCIDVNEGHDKPYYLREKGLSAEGVYIRQGTTNQPLSEMEFLRTMQRIRSRTYESAPSLIQELTFDYASKIFGDKSLSLDTKHMEILKMRNKEGYTNLGFMLSDQFDATIKLAVYCDEDPSSFSSRAIITGSVLKQFIESAEFIDCNNDLSSKIVGINRIDKRSFPPEAIREALLNAIVHRDYSIEGTILINIFKDRLTITSPGSLNETYTIEDLKLGVSSSRNPSLANIFYRLNYCETFGSGIPRIINSYRDSPQPTFTVGSSVFQVCLPSKNYSAGNRILPIINSKESVTRTDIEKLGFSRIESLKILDELIRSGKLTRINGGRSTRYIVNRTDLNGTVDYPQ